MLQQGEVDIAPVDFAITKERSIAVDFLPGMIESTQRLYLKNPDDALHWDAYTEPFTPVSWLGVAFLIAIAPPILAAIILYGKHVVRYDS